MAEKLTSQGLDVLAIDRELPGRGSTLASTSMLWEIDRSLNGLTPAYGLSGRCVPTGRATRDVELHWSGTFDTTSDGLPLIGPVPGAKGVYAPTAMAATESPSAISPHN